jgi:hypothetical protein
MEPPCPVGECYLYAVVSKEKHDAECSGAIVEDVSVARELVDGDLRYRRGPYTENEPWERTRLGLLNAVLDTLIPGARLVVKTGESNGDLPEIYFGRCKAYDRPRDLTRTLRELADCLDFDLGR